jgi:predicted AlkP superfamily pyrophosphatase or phosphodiesterase
MTMMKSFLLTVCSLLIGSLATAESTYVIFISADGLRPDAIDALGEKRAPNFFRLRAEGAWTGNARTDKVYTVTLPNHTSMITGRAVTGSEGHQWILNSDPPLGMNLHRKRQGYTASLFDVAHDHGLRTALYASKSKFSVYDNSYGERTGAPDTTGEDNGRDKIDLVVIEPDTTKLVEEMVRNFASEDFPEVTMLHLRNCDSAGHAETWNLEDGSPYLAAAAEVDRLLGKILFGIDANPHMKGKTALILTSDHGGLSGTKGHGEAKERDNFTIPFYSWGFGVEKGADLYALNSETRADPGTGNPDYGSTTPPIRSGDAGNLILSIFGLPPIPGSTINVTQDLRVSK